MTARAIFDFPLLVPTVALLVAVVMGTCYAYRRQYRQPVAEIQRSGRSTMDRRGDWALLVLSGTLLVCAAADTLRHAQVLSVATAFMVGAAGVVLVVVISSYVERDRFQPPPG